MKAITTERYGTFDDLEWRDVEKPKPKDDEVLINVQAASVNPADRHVLSGKPFLVRLMVGLRKLKHPILGADVAGTVEAVGKNVTQFQVGDEVFGELSGSGFGGFAEYVCAPADVIVHKPAGLTFVEAAAVPMGALTALQGLSEGGITAGQKVLINGASGGVGTFAVQIGKALGAEVTGVCRSAKMETVRALGADHVIDYKQEDFTQNGVEYDLIFDTAAYRPLSDYKKALTPSGVYLLVGGSLDKFIGMLLSAAFLSMRGSQKFKSVSAKANAADLLTIKQMIEAEQIMPVVDRQFVLKNTAEAFRYQADGHATGKVVITCD